MMFQIIGSGGIIETTVDHSDIRGLDTACHGFVVELPLSKIGSLANGLYPIDCTRILRAVITPLLMIWKPMPVLLHIRLFVQFITVQIYN